MLKKMATIEPKLPQTMSVDQKKEVRTIYAIPLNSLQNSEDQVELLKLSPSIVLKKLVNGNLCLINTNQVYSNEQYSENMHVVTPSDEISTKPIEIPINVTNLLKPKILNRQEARLMKCKIPDKAKRIEQSIKNNPAYKKCLTCGEFLKATKYKRHMEIHKNKKKFNCDICKQGFNVEENFKLHMAIHSEGDLICPTCGRKFQRFASLKAHLIVHQVDETFVCYECLAEVNSEEEYKKHMDDHKKNNFADKSDIYKCNHCGVLFNEYAAYKDHQIYHIKIKKMILHKYKRKTNNNKEYAHKCVICLKTFPKYCLLERHMRIHTGDKPFVCTYCNRGFAQKGSLIIHMNRHTGVKPFKCTLCPAKFSQRGNLRVHVEKTHTAPRDGEKYYKCSFCTCMYKKIASLNGHITKFHSSNTANEKNDNNSGNLSKISKENLSEISEANQNKSNSKILMNQIGNSYRNQNKNNKVIDNISIDQTKLNISVINQEQSNPLNNIESKPTNQIEDSVTLGGRIDSHVTLESHIDDSHLILGSHIEDSSQIDNSHVTLGDHIENTHDNINNHIENSQIILGDFIESSHVNSAGQIDSSLLPFGSQTKNCQISLENQTGNTQIVDTQENEPIIEENQNLDSIDKNTLSNSELIKIIDEKTSKVEEFTNDTANLLAKDVEGSNEELLVLLADSSVDESNIKHYMVKQRKNGDVRWYICSYCAKEFKKPSDLIRHMRTHTREKPFKCSYCNNAFSLKSTLVSHIKTHSGKRDYMCSICFKFFTSMRTLNVHIKKHDRKETKFSCSVCGLNFATYSEAENHIPIHEGNGKCKIVRATNVECPVPKNLVSSVVMKQPMVETPNGNLRPVPTLKPLDFEGSKNRPHKCNVCNAAFKKAMHVKRHMLIHTGEKKFTCDICFKAFYTSYACKEHLKFHTGIKNYCCKICNKRYMTNTILKRHMLNHSPDKPFLCPYCKKRFRTVGQCRRHIKIHQKDFNQQLVALTKTEEMTELNHSDALEILKINDCLDSDTNDNANANVESSSEPKVKQKRKYVKRNRLKDDPEQSAIVNAVLEGTEGFDELAKENLLEKQFITIPRGDPPPYPSELNVDQSINSERLQLVENLSEDLQNGYSTIYINYDDLQNLTYNTTVPQIKLYQNTDSILLDPINEQDTNILLSVDPASNEFQTDPINYDNLNTNLIYNSNLLLNDMNEINFTFAPNTSRENESEQIILPSINEINKNKNHLFLNNLTQQQNLGKEKSISPSESVFIDDNLVVLNQSNDLNFVSALQTNLTNFNLELSQNVGESVLANSTSVVNGLYNNPEILCCICKVVLKSVEELEKHQCGFVNDVGKTVMQETQVLEKTEEDHASCIEKNIKITTKQNKKKPVEKNKREKIKVFKNSFSCDECDKKFSLEDSLNRHKKVHNKNDKIIENTCTYCKKFFKKRSDLQRHLRTHTGEKPFACDKCDKSFSLKSTLISHQKTHIPGGNKEFNCAVCNSFFSSKNSLRVHMLVHTGQKPHPCPMCSLKFRTLALRNQHMQAHYKSTVKKSVPVASNIDSTLSQNDQQSSLILENIPLENETETETQSILNEQPTGTIQIDPILFQQLQSSGLLLQDTSDLDCSLKLGLDVQDINQIGSITNIANGINITVEGAFLSDSNLPIETNEPEPVINYKCDVCHKIFENEDLLKLHGALHYPISNDFCDYCNNSIGEEESLKSHMERLHNIVV